MQDSVTVRMKASPAEVWALVSDVTRIGEFSPETLTAEWIDGASGPEIGARFRGQVKRNGRGPTYWTVCEVTDCLPERVFAFDVLVRNQTVNHWGYDLRPTEDGTDVTESFELEPSGFNRLYWKLMGRWRGRTNREGMRATLERIKSVVEGQ